MATEVEAKLIATGPEPLDVLAAVPGLAEASLGPVQTVDELDLYLDTADGRLAGARWACRLRDRGSGPYVSLKGPAGGVDADGMHRRPELEGPANASLDASTWPPSDARDVLLRLTGGGPLTERIRLHQLRLERTVHLDGHPFGVLSLDTVEVASPSQPDRRLAPLHLVELELDASRADDLAALARLATLAAVLAGMDGLRADPTTKLEHAMQLLATDEAGRT